MSSAFPSRLPVVFVSHGAPDTLLKAPAVVRGWREIGEALPIPRAILVVSAHWQTPTPMLSLAGAPATVHDFSGFPPALYKLQYPAPGAPALAEYAAKVLGGGLHPNRGLDHGAWVPLLAMFPQANIPVTQLSVTRQSPAVHFTLGEQLAPLRDEGVLILASGAITHNFGWLDRDATESSPPYPPALAFADRVAQRLAAQDMAALCDYRNDPLGAAAHPTEEHFLPLFVAAGAGNAAPTHHRLPFTYGGLAMDAYVWQ